MVYSDEKGFESDGGIHRDKELTQECFSGRLCKGSGDEFELKSASRSPHKHLCGDWSRGWGEGAVLT